MRHMIMIFKSQWFTVMKSNLGESSDSREMYVIQNNSNLEKILDEKSTDDNKQKIIELEETIIIPLEVSITSFKELNLFYVISTEDHILKRK